jgi:hypothetical protein
MSEAPLTRQKLEEILDEIASYKVDLEEDPTLPHLGTRYLQSSLAKCRHFLNRTQYYLQLARRHEKNLRIQLKQCELNADLQLQQLLANEPSVRQQPSIEDRKAVAISFNHELYVEIGKVRADLLDTEETVKLIKAKYDDLNRTNSDIKLQRHLVRDDKIEQMNGGDGYVKPQANKDRTVEGGLTPAIKTQPMEPEDLWDENRRPDDMPVPVDRVHAQQIADFFGKTIRVESPSTPTQVSKPIKEEEERPLVEVISYDDLL